MTLELDAYLEGFREQPATWTGHVLSALFCTLSGIAASAMVVGERQI